MTVNSDNDLHLWALRMNWLRLAARPLVSLWYLVVFCGQYVWQLAALSGRALRDSFRVRYWLFALFGLAVAVFFLFSFWFLSVKLAAPWLFYIGIFFALLPVGWSMAEIASRERRRMAMDEEYHEDSLYLGNGLKAVRILLKYVVLAMLFIVLQILGTMLLAVPHVGSLLYTLMLVPLVVVSLFSVACLVLLTFGLAIFPSHVLFSRPGQEQRFSRRLLSESGQVLVIIRKNFFRYLFVFLPAVPLAALVLALPAILIGGAYAFSVLLSEGFGALTGALSGIPAMLLAWSEGVLNGNQDVVSALSAVFGAISMSHIVAAVLAPALAFAACLYFRLYLTTNETGRATGMLRERLRRTWDLAPVSAPESGYARQNAADVMIPGVDLLSTDDMHALHDEQERGTGFGGAALATAAGIGAFGGFAAAGAPSFEAEEEPEDSYALEDIESDDLDIVESDDELLVSADDDGGGLLGFDSDEALSLADVETPVALSDSNEDILGTLTSTMEIAAEPVPMDGLPVDDDDRLSLDDVETTAVFLDSNEDILGTLTSTMDIAAEPVPMDGLPVDDDDRLSLDDVDTASVFSDNNEDILGSLTSSMAISGEPVAMDGLEPDEDDRLLLGDIGTLPDATPSAAPSMPSALSFDDEPAPGTAAATDEHEDYLGLADQDADRVSEEVDALIASLDQDLALSGNGRAPILDPQDLERESDALAALDIDSALGSNVDLDRVLDEVNDPAGSVLPLAAGPVSKDDELDGLLAELPSGTVLPDDSGLLDTTIDSLLEPGQSGSADGLDALLAGGASADDGGLAALDAADSRSFFPDDSGDAADEKLTLADAELDDLLGSGDLEPAATDAALDDLLGAGDMTPAASDAELDDLLGGGAVPAMSDAGLDDLLGSGDMAPTASDAELDDLLGGGAAPAMSDAGLDDLLGSGDMAPTATDAELDDLLGGGATPAMSDAGFDDLLGSGDMAPAATDAELDDLLGGGEAPAMSDAGLDDLLGSGDMTPAASDAELDDLLGGSEAPAMSDAGLDDLPGSGDMAPTATDAALDDLLGGNVPAMSDAGLDDLLGSGDMAPVATDAALDDLLTGGDVPAMDDMSFAASDAGLDALSDDGLTGGFDETGSDALSLDDLSGGAGASGPVPARAPAAVLENIRELPAFSGKGQVGSNMYLLSVKTGNQLYFGIKGVPGSGPMNYTVRLEFENGQVGTEEVELDGLDARGMGYTRIDLSRYVGSTGNGALREAAVLPA